MQKVSCRRVVDGERELVAIDRLSFRISVYAIVIKDNAVLLVPQWDGYDFPGGGLDIGETIEEALKREVFEETGLSVDRGEILLAENDFYKHPSTGKYYQSILLYYLCTNPLGEISIENLNEAEREYVKVAEWVPIERIDDLKYFNPVDSPALIKKAVTNMS